MIMIPQRYNKPMNSKVFILDDQLRENHTYIGSHSIPNPKLHRQIARCIQNILFIGMIIRCRGQNVLGIRPMSQFRERETPHVHPLEHPLNILLVLLVAEVHQGLQVQVEVHPKFRGQSHVKAEKGIPIGVKFGGVPLEVLVVQIQKPVDFFEVTENCPPGFLPGVLQFMQRDECGILCQQVQDPVTILSEFAVDCRTENLLVDS